MLSKIINVFNIDNETLLTNIGKIDHILGRNSACGHKKTTHKKSVCVYCGPYGIYAMIRRHYSKSSSSCLYLETIEIIKTTSMENVSTRVLEKINNTKVKPKNDLMYRNIYISICQNTHAKKLRYITHYVKPAAQLLFKIRFPKGGPTCRRQVVNPRHQTPQGQSVAKPETPLQNIQVE